MKKYNIKELMDNTDFEAQRKDNTLISFNDKSDLIINEHIIDEDSILPHDEVVIQTNNENISECKECYFNFSIEKMQQAMSEAGETMPNIKSIKELDEWLDRKE